MSERDELDQICDRIRTADGNIYTIDPHKFKAEIRSWHSHHEEDDDWAICPIRSCGKERPKG